MEEVLRILTWIDALIKAAFILIGIAIALFITLPKLISALKNHNNAKTEEERLAADAAIKNCILETVGIAEQKFKTLNSALKNLGESGAGQLKKDFVLNVVRDLCDTQGYSFDRQSASDYIDKVIDVTKSTNV